MRYLVAFLASMILFVTFSSSNVGTNSLVQTKFKSGISGRVTDPSGAVIVGASVHLVARATRRTVSVNTNDSGEYAADLEPEIYDVEAEAAGFKKARRKYIPVQREARSFVDFMLEPEQE